VDPILQVRAHGTFGEEIHVAGARGIASGDGAERRHECGAVTATMLGQGECVDGGRAAHTAIANPQAFTRDAQIDTSTSSGGPWHATSTEAAENGVQLGPAP